MKKTLLAAALVAGFAGVAHAESSVTLYGLIDAGYGYEHISGKHTGGYGYAKTTDRHFGVRGGVMNGNRWGLKGTEDLGNGTSAIFVLESGFNLGDRAGDLDARAGANDGTTAQGGRLFGRQAYVGLTGDWGTFTIGRQYNAGDAFMSPIDPFGTGGGFASATTIFGDSLSTRYDRVLKYVSPDFSGFQFGIGLVHDDERIRTRWNDVYVNADNPTPGAAGNSKINQRAAGVTTGLGYTNGPLYIGAHFEYVNLKNKEWRNGITQRDTEAKTKAWNIGGTYDFDVVKLHLMYGGQRDGAIGGTLVANGSLGLLADAAAGNLLMPAGDMVGNYWGDGLRQHSWLVGLTAPVGDAGKVMFSYAGNTIKNDEVNTNAVNIVGTALAADSLNSFKVKSHNFALGYRHNLSKRTSVYGVASYGWSEGKHRYGGITQLANTGKIKINASQAIIGLQHRF
jgi:predicted porin